MKFNPSQYQIISTLDRLGIKHETHANHKNWLAILCPNPSHNDHNFGNCSINLSSGFVKCFSCGYGQKGESRKSIINIIEDRLGYNFSQAKQFIEEGGFAVNITQPSLEHKRVRIRKKPLYNFTMINIDPNNFYYTKQRDLTKEFIAHFNIKHVVSGWFSDYLLIPIIDSEKKINEYEGRKLKEFEILQSYYGLEDFDDFNKLKIMFENLCERNRIRLNRKTYRVMIDTAESDDEQLLYLLKPKTLYIQNSRCQETLWNIDNLNRDDILYVVEGLGSVCKIWSNISKNVTAIFGVSITDEQIKYLNQFKEIRYIPDFDKAGFDSVDYLRSRVNNLKIVNTKIEDISKDYVHSIITSDLLTPEDYLREYAVIFRFNLK